MLNLLSQIQTPEDIKNLDISQLPQLAKEIRRFLIKSVAQTGGHLSSNLGIVEITIALHYIFNSPTDKIVWDVGHQAYVHKMLTGRLKDFKTLRQLDGISGFPKTAESVHDIANVGHSSTSISTALGLAVARDLQKENNQVIAVIGDGALTGGMAFEALNNAGKDNTNVIVILNDNEMSISQNVGGMYKYLTRLRSAKQYERVKEDVTNVLYQVPFVGVPLLQTAKRTKEGVKSFFINNTIFEEMGFTYLGPIDGHNIEEVISILENAKQLKGPILIHIKTLKGKGYKFAEQNPSKFHGVTPFNYKTGEPLVQKDAQTFSSEFGEVMCNIAENNQNIIAITAAMSEGTGLSKFEKKFPSRFFDVGIAEAHAVTFASGMALGGYTPVVAVYSSFLQRAYDQILHDVGLQNLKVIFAIDRAGLVGEDGETHQGIFDIAYLSHIPNICLLCPKIPEEIGNAMQFALKQNGPVAIRYPRGKGEVAQNLISDYNSITPIEHFKGRQVVIVATGKSVLWALKIKEYLQKKYNMNIGIVEVACIKPLDVDTLFNFVKRYKQLVTIEDHVLVGGFGTIVANSLHEVGYSKLIQHFGYKDGVIEHGKIDELLEKQGLLPHQIGEAIKARVDGK
ncbi:MAG: 1-deoxy-D-xylulose-5-phosphate synthase [Epulopiscium sp. Nele67-Bin005]|nr:MAG: 1-deoxy-D-xylulose-5-phosphate synthase [Epulopiscium sp. Nele67-Bin005]